jgi:hypothetical protein
MKFLEYDIETLLECFHIGIYVNDEDTWYSFTISKYENQIDGFIRFTEKYKEYYWVGYNSLRFDSQVVEWIIRNYDLWHELDGLSICNKISQKAQDIIDDANYDVFPEYSEYSLSLKQIDLFKIWHFDNKNRRVSLKRLEFEMDLENIEEMPIHHLKENLTIEEVQTVKDYCKNDVWATYQFYLITRGQTDHPLYKGNDQIQLRLDIEKEFGINCMNYSDSKIGDEIIKKYYCEAKNISYKQLPKKGFFRKKIDLKYCIPKNVEFKSKQLQEFLKSVKKQSIGINDDFNHEIKFFDQKYTFAKGGLHNTIKGKIYESNDEYILKDIDVSGFYPGSIINYSYYPFHLGKEFLVGYSKVYHKRIELKPLAKKDNKIKGIVAALKNAGNCPFGKSGDMTSWLYDKQMLLSTTLTGQFCILMLIEACELNGIKCIMANTDGISVLVKRSEIDKFNKIKEEWINKTVNTINFETEEVDYKKLVFSSVNHYIAEKFDGEAKFKGDFIIDSALYMNKSNKIVRIALKEYYLNNIPVEETIKNHKNIYDFCIRQKSTKDFHYEGLSKNGKTIYKKLIRYYVSNTGEKILKIKNPECTTNAAAVSQVEAGDYLMTVCNYLPKTTKVEDCNINYQYYIDKAYRIINKVKLSGRKEVKKQPINQLNMFG